MHGGSLKMSTQLTEAKKGHLTKEMRAVAICESIDPQIVLTEIASGHAVLPANKLHKKSRYAIAGRKFRTKVNANIGCSTLASCEADELKKLHTALEAGADFIMDLSVGKNLAKVRQKILKNCPVPLGTVPIYEAFARANNNIKNLNGDLILEIIREQAEQGVDFMTLHAGILLQHLPLVKKRRLGIVSRGGVIIAEWMTYHQKENPVYTQMNKILDICRKHDVTISLGDGLRPGCVSDSSDAAQFAELKVLGNLVKFCRSADVQSMVEGPGHLRYDHIKMNIEKEILVCDDAPFYVLGPVVTDIAPGYDHIVSAIGGTAAAYYGASILCYVTPAEHLGLPTVEEVKEGVITHKIAAHAADLAKEITGAIEPDNIISDARMNFDWETQFKTAIDGKKARSRYLKGNTSKDSYCSMCGEEFCALRRSREMKKKNVL